MRLLLPARVVVSARGAGRPATEAEGRGDASARLVAVPACTFLPLLCTLRLRVTLKVSEHFIMKYFYYVKYGSR